ncbi:hypothetical protein [Paenibacillus koleovorans]|uniref:hypothetical protein n=1 Tax=Paenibacillus koleovorans TaxID=121608 RepID=UPI000FDB9DA2|nr:hypothetical protein [Paenibacillus koleovorans]
MTESQEPKKKSLAEAAKAMLAQKKQAQQGGGASHQKSGFNNGPAMKNQSQNVNKPNSMRRKMGSS